MDLQGATESFDELEDVQELNFGGEEEFVVAAGDFEDDLQQLDGEGSRGAVDVQNEGAVGRFLEDPGRLAQKSTRRWNDIFSSNRRPENGVVIDYSAPITRSVVDFTVDDFCDSIEFWSFALIGTVVGAKIPVDAMKRFVASR